MNYVLYFIGAGSILAAFLGFGRLVQLDPHFQNVLANALIVYLSGSLALFGIFCCAFGSAIGLLKKIVENTRGVQLRSY
jgi:hypothetical protein